MGLGFELPRLGGGTFGQGLGVPGRRIMET